ncbi:hypothetical protein ACFE04_004387 [Oxalis oulophora]
MQVRICAVFEVVFTGSATQQYEADVKGVEDFLNEGMEVNNIDLNGRKTLHIGAYKGHIVVVKLLLSRKTNIDARDRCGSTKTYKKTPMTISNPREVPQYKLNPLELQVRKVDGLISSGQMECYKGYSEMVM